MHTACLHLTIDIITLMGGQTKSHRHRGAPAFTIKNINSFIYFFYEHSNLCVLIVT